MWVILAVVGRDGNICLLDECRCGRLLDVECLDVAGLGMGVLCGMGSCCSSLSRSISACSSVGVVCGVVVGC